ncbi:unnamed protein product, partial [Musa hybrid cultivar]
PALVNLTLIPSAAAKGAVCLDGTVPGYHLHRGFGSGADNWLVDLEGGGWCNDVGSCLYAIKGHRGSSNYMEKLYFSGILSDKPEQNPDFYNWNRVEVRYCDGASFAGEGFDGEHNLYFRGQRIWSAVMEDLMSKGMRSAKQALLSGCSAGGLASILHCDEFRALFPQTTKVKCLSDAGFFVDLVDISGGHAVRSFYDGVVTLQGVAQNLPKFCTSRMNATSCFFPQYIVANITTPTFLLNAAYDTYQIQQALAPISADPKETWKACKFNHSACDSNQMQILQGFRNTMLNALQGFAALDKNGHFINSCFTHGQIYDPNKWYSDNSPTIGNKRIATSVGDWYFDRSQVKSIDCAYPCDNTCHHDL